MTHDVRTAQRRIGCLQSAHKAGEYLVLHGFIGAVIDTLKLNAYREIVTALAATIQGFTSVPGPLVKRYVLSY